jgi:hypothetical protein
MTRRARRDWSILALSFGLAARSYLLEPRDKQIVMPTTAVVRAALAKTE